MRHITNRSLLRIHSLVVAGIAAIIVATGTTPSVAMVIPEYRSDAALIAEMDRKPHDAHCFKAHHAIRDRRPLAIFGLVRIQVQQP